MDSGTSYLRPQFFGLNCAGMLLNTAGSVYKCLTRQFKISPYGTVAFLYRWTLRQILLYFIKFLMSKTEVQIEEVQITLSSKRIGANI